MSKIEEVKTLFVIALVVVLLFLIFILGIVLLIKKRQQELLLKIQLEEEKLKNELLLAEMETKNKLDSERERISLDLHDDLGANLSVIGLKAEFLRKSITDKSILEGLSEIVENTHEVAISMREMMWSLNARKDNIEEFMNYVKQYISHYFEHTGITTKISISNSHFFAMSSFIRRQLFLCIKEACNNIVKHSRANTVVVNIDWMEPTLLVKISDDGIGIKESHPQGNGIYSMRKRLTDLGGDFQILNLKTGGTMIKISITLV